MTSYAELRGTAEVWPCVVNREYMIHTEFQDGSFLADYAKHGKWAQVLKVLRPENHLVNVNQSWPGDASRSTALHRAAELAAPDDVVATLLSRGALRSLRDAEGRTPYDIAVAAGASDDRLEMLRPEPSPFDAKEQAALDAVVTDVIDNYIEPGFRGKDLRRILRYPPVGILHEPPGRQLWMQVPYFNGGFRIMLRDGRIELLGGYRRFDGGEVQVTTHEFVATPLGWTLVHESVT